MSIPRRLGGLAASCSRRPGLVVAGTVLLALAALLPIHARLGVTTDTGGLFSARLPWKQHSADLQRAFPQNEDLLVAVVDASVPEAADATADALAAALATDAAHFKLVRRPDAASYLRRNALMFLEPKPLEALLNQTIDAQPFLGQLAADPSARGLFRALSLIALGVAHGEADLAGFRPALSAFDTALAAAADGKPRPLSWQRLLAGSLADQAGRFRFVLAKPNLDYGSFQPGGAATAAMRAAIAKLDFVRDGTARVRITGSVALDDEEFATVAQGALTGLAGSLVLITLWLFLAVRSWRLIVPIILSLLLGLLLTTGFAAAAVGTLNLVSVAFAILFVGIAVDFAIQFSVRFREHLHGRSLELAVSETGRRAGVQILVAAAATAAGFLAFTPTAFAGVAQLGLIAGVGMLIAFAVTLTFLPACLTLFRPRAEAAEIGFAWARPVDAALERHRRLVAGLFAALAVAGVALLPWLRFDGDPLHTKDPTTEAMRALTDLMDDPLTSPYSLDILRPALPDAQRLAQSLGKLPLVADTLTLASLVPEGQEQKLPLIADARDLLAPVLSAQPPGMPPNAGDIRGAAAKTAGELDAVLEKVAAEDPLRRIAADLHRLAQRPDADQLAASRALTQFLPGQLALLRDALSPQKTTAAEVPPDVAQDWIAPDGRARVQVLVKHTAQDSAGLSRFVHSVWEVAPDAAGSAATIVASAETIVAAFRSAAILAIVAITAILALALRRVLDVALVLAPLLLSALLTVGLAVVLPLPLNFANIIALPLLLGVGVSFNIYFVMNWRAGRRQPLASATARAILFSALTTATAFGSLALSHHPGTASMGDLLLLSLACTLAVTFVFLPALLAATPVKARSGGE